MASRGSHAARLVRLGEWWNHKIPPLLAIAYLLLGEQPIPLVTALQALALFLATSIGTAVFGHLLNDVSDIEQDRAAGVSRGIHDLRPRRRHFVLFAALAAAIAPWAGLPRDAWNMTLFAAVLALLAAYSLPPIRLKERGVSGALADALYAHALPVGVVTATFRLLAGEEGPWIGWLAGSLFAWKLAQGLCGALVGQIRGRHADHRSGARTLVARWGPRRALAWVNRLLLPIQTLTFLMVCATISWRYPWFAPIYPIFFAAALFKILWIWRKPRSFFRRSYAGYILLNDFHELWMPPLLILPAILRDPAYAWVLALHLLLFRSGPSRLLRSLATAISERRTP